MTTHDKNLIQKVLKWIEYAEDDWFAAQQGVKSKTKYPTRIIAFHS